MIEGVTLLHELDSLQELPQPAAHAEFAWATPSRSVDYACRRSA